MVLDMACATLAGWQASSDPNTFVAVNLSPRQLVQPELYAKVKAALAAPEPTRPG